MYTIFYHRHTRERNRIVSISSTILKDSDGFYKGFDLIPSLLQKDKSIKNCQCGVWLSSNNCAFFFFILTCINFFANFHFRLGLLMMKIEWD